MKILTFNQQNDLAIDTTSVETMVREVLLIEKTHPDELAVYFVSKEEICQLHEEFFNDPSPTDCISFPIDGSYLGEVFVCPQVACETILQMCEELTDDPYQETSLYVVHGLLHLMGYDDQDENKRLVMEKKQNQIMQTLIEKKLLLSA